MAADIEFNVRNGMTVGGSKHMVLDINGALSGSNVTCTTGQFLSGGQDLLDIFSTSGAVGYTTDIGDDSTTSINVTHGLDSVNVIYSLVDTTTNEFVATETTIVDSNTINFNFTTAPSVGKYRVVVISTDGSGGSGSSSSGGNSFTLNEINTAGTTTQNTSHTHTIYDCTAGDIIIDLADPSSHSGVTQHKRIDNSSNTVTLSSSTGLTIDGESEYIFDIQYESIGIYTNGTEYFIQ